MCVLNYVQVSTSSIVGTRVSQDRKMTSSHTGDHSVSFILTEDDSGLKLGQAQLCTVGLGK